MHTIKRIFSLCLVLLMLAQFLPVVRAETTQPVVYLDSVNGSDSNDGLTEAKAVKTLEGAYNALKYAMLDIGAIGDETASGRIVLVNDYNFAFTTSSYKKDIANASNYAHIYEVIICGKTPDVCLSFTTPKQSYLGVVGPTTFEDLNLRIAEGSANSYLSIHGRSGSFLKMGKGITTSNEERYKISLSGAPYFNTSKACTLQIDSGDWRNVYAGMYTGNLSVTNDVYLIINGGSVMKAGVVYNGTHSNDASIIINGGKVAELYTAAVNNGTVSGNVTVELNGGELEGGIVTKSLTGTATVKLAPEKGVKLSGGTEVSVNQLTGGQLTIVPGTKLNVTDSVTGTTNVTVDGGVLYGDYVTAPAATADNAIVFAQEGITVTESDTTKTWGCTDESKLAGLVLTAKTGVTVKLYPGFSGGSAITPTTTTTEGNTVRYFFPNVAGSYRYIASGTGYYKITKNIYIDQKEAGTVNTMDVTPPARTGKGWDPVAVTEYTDELLAHKPSDPKLWPAYQEAFETPQFTQPGAVHQHTTQQEMESYIAAINKECAYMYTYSYGTTAYGNDLPMVIFTKSDLTGAKTIEDAAAILKANGKLTIHYQAHMHGNEPAAGEGALAMINKLSGSYGQQVLDDVNIYVLPRLNPDGAQDDIRKIPTTGIDMNRDYLLLQNTETRLVTYVTDLFEPTVMIDSHEYTCEITRTKDAFPDLLISPGFNPTSGEDFTQLGITMTESCFKKAAEQNLSYNYYTSIINSKNAYVGRNYAALKGTLFFLIESRGINGGTNMYERRVVGHLITATQLIDYICANKEQVQTVVDAERQRLVDTGKTYEESDVLVLGSSSSKHPEHNINAISYNTATGVGSASVLSISVYDVIDRSRPAPTAYVIPAGQSWTQKVLELMDAHGIGYDHIPAGAVVNLQQYTGTTAAAELTQEMAVSFQQGAYVMTMDQVGSKVLGMLMEPDVDDLSSANSTLAMAGMIPCENGSFPIYRYIRDLNAGMVDYVVAPAAPTGLAGTQIPVGEQTGSITGLLEDMLYEYRTEGQTDYTQVAAGSMTIANLAAGTYYVRYCATATQAASADAIVQITYAPREACVVYLSANGNDSNDGFTQAAPVATVAKAYSQLHLLMETASAGTEGRIVLIGTIDLGSKKVDLPSHDYPVTVTGLKATDGFTYKGTGEAKTTLINFNGPTTLENLKVTLTSTTLYNYLAANGHKLVIGQGVTCVANSKGAYFNVCGGSYNGSFTSTDVTIMSGSWRNIYYGTYTGTVSGDAKLTMTGGAFTNYIQSNYNGTVSGNTYITLSDTQLGTRVMGGNANTGTLQGNATVTLGKGITGTPDIAPGAGTAALNGSFTVILDGADSTGMTIHGVSLKDGTVGSSKLLLKNGTLGAVADVEAVVLATDGYVKLGADLSHDVTVEGDSYLDLAGHVLTGSLSGTGALFGMDSATDDYTADKAGRITGSISCAVEKHMKTDVTGATRRYLAVADDTGYTFHRFFLGITHASLKPHAKGMGYKAVFAGSDVVKAHIDAFGYSLQLEGNDAVTRELDGTRFESLRTVTLRVDNYDAEKWGAKGLTAQVYMVIDGQTVTGTECIYSLKDMVELVNHNAASFSADQLAAIASWISESAAMKTWNVENIYIP